MQCLRLFPLVVVAAGLVSCDTPGAFTNGGTHAFGSGSKVAINGVKTTAYTHTEADHLKYSVSTAAGTTLKYGIVRSAAADWSVYPVGTVFQIEGDPYIYQIDDYGSALVGTNTIDLYKPDRQSMNEWGARNVNIKVLKWGSASASLAIMKDREKKYPHVKQMVQRIENGSS